MDLERLLGRLRSLSLLDDDESEEELLEREVLPELELEDDLELEELLSEELKYFRKQLISFSHKASISMILIE